MRKLLRIVVGTPSRQILLAFAAAGLLAPMLSAQTQAQTQTQAPALVPDVAHAQSEDAASISHPIAIVPLDTSLTGHAFEVTGDLRVANGRALVDANASIVSGGESTHVALPYRGTLMVCAYTTVKLTADTGGAAGEVPGLMMAMEHGALEMSFAAGRANTRNADMLLTPDFRILINGQGAADVKVRLGPKGDTCVDNPGADAPYVVVSSLFDGGAYRVQPGQRVMFQHGSLHEVVDDEKEPCGCPPPEPKGNEFPLAQSMGLAPLAKPSAAPELHEDEAPAPVGPLVYNSAAHAPEIAAPPPEPPKEVSTAAAAPAAPTKKPGFFGRVGRFFKRMFGAE